MGKLAETSEAEPRRKKTLNASSATMVFLTYAIAQIVVSRLIEAIGGSRMGPLAEFLCPIIGIAVVVVMALTLIPKDLTNAGPTGPAWTLGAWDAIIKGLLIGSFLALAPLLLDALYPSYPTKTYQMIERIDPMNHMLASPGVQQLLACIAIAFLGPISEEMMYRGVLYGGYRKSFGPVWAALVTTVVFVFVHFPKFFDTPHTVVCLVVISAALLWCRLHWNAIGPAIAAHGGYNLVAVVIPSLIFTWHHSFYESGVAEYKASNFNQAIANLTRAIQLGDHSSDVYVYRGLAKFKEGDMNGAISDYNKAIQLNPKERAAYYDRGLARVGEGELDAAVADFNKAIELNPTNSLYYNDRGWAEFLEGDTDSSINDATRSIQLDPDFGDAYGTRGWARYQKGDLAGAIEDCKKSTALYKQGSASFFFDQGLLDFIANDYKKAVADWQNSIQMDPGSRKELQPWIERAQKASIEEKH